ncbi:MAG: hypothetical protein FJ405_14175 [Verrucomicrobia bacterium]|nr:hypothetical protein [Verrucomicrobiota bacterium]
MNAGITDPGVRSCALLLGDWQRLLMLHFEVDAQALQTDTPFDLDLWNSRAFITLVAFRMANMRLQHLGRFGGWALAPIRSHEFLNVRTYVRCEGTPGISFLAEWVPNPLSCWLGPRLFSIP